MYLLGISLLAVCILVGCAAALSQDPDYNQSLTPAQYQGIIEQGFATNYFKARNGPAIKYREQNIQDIYDKGFRNLRLRCRADLDFYEPPYNETYFDYFLGNLTEVVDECLDVGVIPIISWIHHDAEIRADDTDRQNYVTWWTRVANHLKDKDYRLAFNLFTELGWDPNCRKCTEALGRNITKYRDWTSSVVQAIRNTTGNNPDRILILASPRKTEDGLSMLEDSANSHLLNDSHILVEWHEYAAGPSSVSTSPRYWTGNGTEAQRNNLIDALNTAQNFTDRTSIPTYFGAWMPRDNSRGELDETEVKNFATFFVTELKNREIPWSMNVLDDYYDTENSNWHTNNTFKANDQQLNVASILQTIIDNM